MMMMTMDSVETIVILMCEQISPDSFIREITNKLCVQTND